MKNLLILCTGDSAFTILGPVSGPHFNPATTPGRAFINPAHLPGFVLAQIVGALVALAIATPLFQKETA